MVVASTEVSEQAVPAPPMSASRRKQLDRTLQQACLAARVLEDTRGQDNLVLDLTGVTSIVDFFIVTTGTSSRQMKAMAEEVHKTLKHEGSKRIGFEGEDSTECSRPTSGVVQEEPGRTSRVICGGCGRCSMDDPSCWKPCRRLTPLGVHVLHGTSDQPVGVGSPDAA